MTDEKQKVLEMLKNGKINQEQAAKLLAVLESKCQKEDFEQKMSGFNKRFERPEIDESQQDIEVEETIEVDEQIEDNIHFDVSQQDNSWNFHINKPNKPKINGKVKVFDFSDLAKEFEEFGKNIEQHAHIYKTAGGFSIDLPIAGDRAKNGVFVKREEDKSKNFSDCSMALKYSKGAFVFKGNFDLTKVDTLDKCLKPLVSESAWQAIDSLMKEQFVGNYKQVGLGEVLKVEIG